MSNLENITLADVKRAAEIMAVYTEMIDKLIESTPVDDSDDRPFEAGDIVVTMLDTSAPKEPHSVGSEGTICTVVEAFDDSVLISKYPKVKTWSSGVCMYYKKDSIRHATRAERAEWYARVDASA